MNVVATSPAHAVAREARASIERAAGALRESRARFDRRGVEERLTRGVRALYAVIDTPLEAPAHHDGLTECARVLSEARGLLAAEDDASARAARILDEEIARVRAASEEVLDVLLARRSDRRFGAADASAPSRPFQASVAMPRLHALARSPLAPTVSVEPREPVLGAKPNKKAPPPKPATLEELRAAAASSAPVELPEEEEAPASEAPAPAPDEGELLRRVARDCLEDIASLSLLRKPIPTETWLDQAPFEQRLLDNVDAFVAFGEAALPSVTLFHAEAPAPDPARGFAVALTLGCIEGTDALDVVIATMKHSAPEELPGFAEGLVLAPSPSVDAELPALLEEANPALVGVAVDVLGARGSLPPDAIPRVASRGDPALTMKLARALGLAGPKAHATAALTEMLESGADDALFALACESLLRRGDGAVRDRLRRAIRERESEARVATATALLAISGRASDTPLLLEGLALAPDEASVRALGRHGSADAVPSLIALLDSEELAAPAAEALDFLTGAGLRETKQVPWTSEEPPDGSPVPTRAVSVVIADRAAWEAWRARARLDPQKKLRGGAPFTPMSIVDELAGRAPVARREEALVELVVATGVGMRLSTRDWVARQKSRIEEVRELARSLGGAPGSYWFAGASS